jgi:tetratricopeptide (TPR) repeat protein
VIRPARWFTLFAAALLATMAPGPVPADETQPSRKTYLRLIDIQELWDEKRYEEAIGELQELAGETRDNPRDYALTHQYLAHTYVMNGQSARARAALETALGVGGLAPQLRAELQLFYGQVLVGAEEFETARENLEAWYAVTEEPPQPSEVFALSYANYMTGNLERAGELLEQLIAARDGWSEESWDRLHYQILFDQQRYEEAEQVIMTLVARRPDYEDYWLLLVNHYMRIEESREALATLVLGYLQEQFVAAADKERMVSLYGHVEIPEKAARLLEQWMADGSLERTPDNLRRLGDLWLLARERARAKAALLEAAGVAPDGRTYELLGGIYLQDEEWARAHEAFAEALALGGLNNPDRVHLLAGLSAQRAGRYAEARESLERAKASEPFRRQAEALLRQLPP